MKTFIRELKESVKDESLQVFGRGIIRATSATSVNIWITVTEKQTISVLDPNGNEIYSQIVDANGKYDHTIDTSSYDYVDFIIPKSNKVKEIYCLTGTYGGGQDAKYYTKLEYFSNSEIPEYSKMVFCDLSASNYFDNIFLSWETIYLSSPSWYFYYWKINNIGFLGGCLSLQTLNRTDNSYGDIYGEFMDVFSDQCKNGRTAGTINISMTGTGNYTTFAGEILGDVTFSVTFNSYGCVISPSAEFTAKTGYSAAVYDLQTDKWTLS